MDTLEPGVAHTLDDYLTKAKSAMYSYESLNQLYIEASKTVDDWFVVIDGLDECNAGTQSSLLKFLGEFFENLPNHHRTKILFSSRETSSITINQTFPNTPRITTGMGNTSADITVFAGDIIQEKLSTGDLVVGDIGLTHEILKTIVLKEQGM